MKECKCKERIVSDERWISNKRIEGMTKEEVVKYFRKDTSFLAVTVLILLFLLIISVGYAALTEQKTQKDFSKGMCQAEGSTYINTVIDDHEYRVVCNNKLFIIPKSGLL